MKNIYLDMYNIFQVFEWMLFVDMKVVILGQDLYYGFGQVYGLSFLVLLGVVVFLLLVNIYKEL